MACVEKAAVRSVLAFKKQAVWKLHSAHIDNTAVRSVSRVESLVAVVMLTKLFRVFAREAQKSMRKTLVPAISGFA